MTVKCICTLQPNINHNARGAQKHDEVLLVGGQNRKGAAPEGGARLRAVEQRDVIIVCPVVEKGTPPPPFPSIRAEYSYTSWRLVTTNMSR